MRKTTKGLFVFMLTLQLLVISLLSSHLTRVEAAPWTVLNSFPATQDRFGSQFEITGNNRYRLRLSSGGTCVVAFGSSFTQVGGELGNPVDITWLGNGFWLPQVISSSLDESNIFYVESAPQNQIPTTPGNFITPSSSSSLREGVPITVHWSASTDGDDDPIYYQLEFYNGTTWSNIVTTGATCWSWTVPNNVITSTAKLRVKALDNENASSGYKESGTFTIYQNQLPQIAIFSPSANQSFG